MSIYHEISNVEDVMDSRDVIDQINKLEELRADFLASGELDTRTDEWLATDEGRELTTLLALQEDASNSPGWRYGETLIRDSYFIEYAEELANEICDMKSTNAWPFCHIDWEAAADALKQDYFSVDFDGVTYWIRS